MRAVDQWAAIEEGLPRGWSEARLAFRPEGQAADAAAALAALRPGRVGDELQFTLERALGDASRLRGLLERLDEKRLWGALVLLDVDAPAAETEQPEGVRVRLVESWEEVVATLPPDWSDVLCELELDSSDWVPRAALLGAALNPTRNPEAIALRFRASGKAGYGASPGMVRRSLERMDAEGITGRVSVLVELSGAEKAVTQGAVWRMAGRSV